MSEHASRAVARPKAAVMVADALRRQIVLGDLAEGSPLPNETELMSQHGVSRPTLREALRILESEDLIIVKRGAGGGARVSRPDPSVVARHAATALRLQGTTLGDVFTARSIIEPAAVGLLLQRVREDGTVLAPLRAIHQESLEVGADAQRYAVLAARFHEQVIELAGNTTLALLGLILLDIVETHNRATFAAIESVDETLRHAQRDHAELLGLLEQGDERAVELWADHMSSAADAGCRALGADAPLRLVAPPL